MTWKTTGNKEVKTNDTKTNVQEDMVNHPILLGLNLGLMGMLVIVLGMF
jgi:hypothetical protein